MAELTYDKLSAAGIEAELPSVPNWTIEEGELTRRFTFETYKDGLVFAVAVGYAADELNHHPELTIGIGHVRVSLVTHEAGGGLTAYDFEFARRVDRLGR
ncbi:MAG: 4a-hydroxytetrahydrobiopterin dehydratase [Armatimonadetes bacterium]|nr:4a-hydroxytetrahydrobiopterin dehydratase [Armatimonadota bacterium]MBS1712074.1 4a-hydroxytetrahydrobiopterin dehydratase [Armatimonadota bacterium]MBX3109372.1 4a-hydroxytetrahydrobiopterin dehydratase [Fimbriimonadaceae bacterium]